MTGIIANALAGLSLMLKQPRHPRFPTPPERTSVSMPM